MSSRAEVRREIKAIAKENFKKQWGTSIALLLLVGIIAGAGSIVVWIPVIGWIASMVVPFLVGMPLAVNAAGLYVKIYKDEKASVDELFSQFKVRYERKVGGMAWAALFIWLWSLVGIFTLGIVTIIKGISYSMVSYILADCPNVTAKDALKLSMRMTQGHKMDLFVMYLSFIGWFLLGGLTLHILTVVFVAPYMSTTQAGFYTKLKAKAIESGAVSLHEFHPELAGEEAPNAN